MVARHILSISEDEQYQRRTSSVLALFLCHWRVQFSLNLQALVNTLHKLCTVLARIAVLVRHIFSINEDMQY